MDEWESKYKTMRTAYLTEHTTNTILSAENDALALSLRTAIENWMDASESWAKAAFNALSGWRRRNQD